MSVDGFVTGPDLDKWPGLGRGGERLHAWLEHDEGRRLSEATFAASGAIVTSRRVYEATGGWGEDGFYRMPIFVITHRPHTVVRKGDTLSSIAAKYRVSVISLKSLNQVGRVLQVGQKIYIR